MRSSASREESSSSSGFEDRDFQRGPKWSEHEVKVMPEGEIQGFQMTGVLVPRGNLLQIVRPCAYKRTREYATVHTKHTYQN